MAKKKEMNRTSGTARRLTGRSEGIATKLKYGAPLTGSASGVKSISLKDAGEVLTQGIVTLGKKGLKFAPEGLAMALPLGKVAKAAGALRAAGKLGKAAALESRIGAKIVGGETGKTIAKSKKVQNGYGISGASAPFTKSIGSMARDASEGVFPRGTDLAKRALKAGSETRAASKALGNQQFGFDRFVREADRIERKYGLTQRTAEEGLRQAKKLKGK